MGAKRHDGPFLGFRGGGAWTGCPLDPPVGGGGAYNASQANSQTNDCSETGEVAFAFGLGETVSRF